MAEEIARNAHLASTVLKTLSNDERSHALHMIRDGLLQAKDKILSANKIDMQTAIDNNLSSSLIKRLDLSINGKFDSMLDGIIDVANLDDPLNKITLATQLDDGLNLYRLTCPVGVLLIIFESRPEVIANITALAIKSGNAAILKGGKESLNTFKEISDVINDILLNKTKVPNNSIQLISTRDEVSDLLSQDKYIDLVIPRGSNELVKNIKENTKIPVLGHADGICSIYLDKDLDIEKAIKIVIDAKTNYPAGCNAVETILIDENLDNEVKSTILTSLLNEKIKLHIEPSFLSTLDSQIKEKYQELIVEATEDDFSKEFLSLELAVKQVHDVNGAIIHINSHSSKHTDAIITENKDTADRFLKGIDSSGVYWNCSTRFADGFRYGFGTEVGISTNKIHSRGPVGLEGLVCYYYQMRGSGQVVGDYLGGGGTRVFKHLSLDPKNITL
ncbi:glutamate-5-semialdehyde dehydrogenase [Pichia kluyveri]|uniref:glutamate-5-semialdehyde dehydrogenase n=1 Tax=Pichia kluyveri TaxID=36015 RepID=A0AAV5QZY0_PICKL|nr:glutamate-5-semialdehyde dehydrogenase [Pichia kluyveri]